MFNYSLVFALYREVMGTTEKLEKMNDENFGEMCLMLLVFSY
jgi:hypothetical protein